MQNTLTDLLAAFLAHGKSRNMSPVTLRTRRYHIEAFIRRACEHDVYHIERVSRTLLAAWCRSLSSHRTTRGLPLKPRSLNKQIESVRSFITWLSRRGYLQANLLEALEYIKEPQLLPTSVLTHAQMKKLLRQIPGSSGEAYRDRCLLELLYSTGARISEALGLDLGDIDMQNRTALLMGKGRKQRVVPIGETAVRCLESYLRAVRPYLLRDPREQAVFLQAEGKRLAYHTVRRRIKRYAIAARMDIVVTAHTFRRSCTTELLRSGANMYHVKELLGHENLDTLKHYAKLTITDLKATHQRCHPREKDS
jgi:integrase/recombinase XerD